MFLHFVTCKTIELSYFSKYEENFSVEYHFLRKDSVITKNVFKNFMQKNFPKVSIYDRADIWDNCDPKKAGWIKWNDLCKELKVPDPVHNVSQNNLEKQKAKTLIETLPSSEQDL